MQTDLFQISGGKQVTARTVHMHNAGTALPTLNVAEGLNEMVCLRALSTQKPRDYKIIIITFTP